MTGWLERRLPVPRRPALWIGWLRLGLLPVAATIVVMIYPERVDGEWFAAVLVAAGLYAVLALVAGRSAGGRPAGGWRPYVFADVVLMAALVYFSGGVASPLRSGLILVPVVVAIFGRPRDTLAAMGGTLIALVSIAALPTATGNPPTAKFVFGAGLFLAWSCVLVLALSLFLHLRARRAIELSESRQRLVAQAVTAEERARRRLAVGLHDDPVQALLAARLSLQRATNGDAAALEGATEAVDHTLGRLREAIFELHPPALEHSGLGVTLKQLAAHHTSLGAAPIEVDVDPRAEGLRDELVFAIARELVSNAVKHANADGIDVRLRRRAGLLRLEVKDDGDGMPTADRREGIERGHIGLAATAERVDAAGGTFEIDSQPDRGTRVAVVIPAVEKLRRGDGEQRPRAAREAAAA